MAIKLNSVLVETMRVFAQTVAYVKNASFWLEEKRGKGSTNSQSLEHVILQASNVFCYVFTSLLQII